jgi:hypothetical protein
MQEGETAKNRGGRPTERDEAKRAPINMRITPATRSALDAAAAREGRSLAQEIEQRLERSLELEKAQGGPATAALVATIVADIAEIERLTGKSWAVDNETYFAVRRAVIAAILDRTPDFAENSPEVVAALQEVLAQEKAINVALRITRSGGGLELPGRPVDSKAARAFQAEIEASLPAAEAELREAKEALDRALAPQREAERRGRKIFSEIHQRRKLARELRRRR